MEDKYRVTMRSMFDTPNGQEVLHEAIDFVPVSVLDYYVADAKTKWEIVEVSAEPDFGPVQPA